MNKHLLKKYLPDVAIVCLTAAFMNFALEYLLFGVGNFNLYRVLDNSVQNGLVILLIILLQYALLKRSLTSFSSVWQHIQSAEKPWSFAAITLILTSGVYSLLPLTYPVCFFLLFLVGLSLLSIAKNSLKNSPFSPVILMLFFGAGMNTFFVFWTHEETNEKIHFQYARQLAERRDSIAEANLAQIIKKQNPAEQDGRLFWEKEWMENTYLSSNYRLRFHENTSGPSTGYNRPVLEHDESFRPVYWLYLPENQALSFRLNNPNRRSVYTTNQAYKNLDQLNNYLYAVVHRGKVVFSNTHDFDLGLMNLDLPPVGQIKKAAWENYDAKVYRHAPDTYVLIGEPFPEFWVLISNFAFFFALFIFSALLWELGVFLTSKKTLSGSWKNLPIQHRIQTTLFSSMLLLFIIISITTFYFLHQNNQMTLREKEIYISEMLRREILEKEEQAGWELPDFTVDFLYELADRKQGDIDVYDAQGQLILSSIASAGNSPAPPQLDPESLEAIRQNPFAIFLKRSNEGQHPILQSSFGVSRNHQLQGFVVFSSFEREVGTAQDIPMIMSKLLNVYIFLLLLAWGVGLLLVNILTKPLEVLAIRLGNFKLGKQNKKLNWESNDAIGRLIGEYNKMVDTVEQTRKELVKSEREGAWQIMAQQIAHEINNPLTPLRLNIQYFSHLLDSPTPPPPALLQRLTGNLETQIDQLAKTASRFQLFAKMGTPRAVPLELDTFLKEFATTYSPGENCQLYFEEKSLPDTPVILMDRDHLWQIVHNIVSNAVEAIPDEKQGIVNMRLLTRDEKAIIEIEDNGEGIEEHLRENIFNPKFSTRSSRTGLGLPICYRIVEFYGGELSFTTEIGTGTTFRIRFDLEKSEGLAVRQIAEPEMAGV